MCCAGGLSAPLFLHSSIHEPGAAGALSESTPEKEWQARVSQIFREQVNICVRIVDHTQCMDF